MNKNPQFFLFLLIFLGFLVIPLFSDEETLMMRFPDIYKDEVVFSYAGDLWLTKIDDDYARRLTTGEGVKYFPKFSPDGKWIAFTGQYEGYSQVYVMPTSGGSPIKLTFYPSSEMYDNQIMDWTLDGQYIIFRSNKDRNIPIPARGRFFKINHKGGWPEPLPLSEGASLSFSPDGKKIAFTQVFREFAAWKRYKGGQAQDVWIYDFIKDRLERITDWIGGDYHPIWHENRIYFVSDRTGTANLYSYNTITRETHQVTNYRHWDVKWPSAGPDAIVYELGGKLYRFAFADETISPMKIRISYDRANLRHYVDARKNLESSSLASGGKQVVFGARGELFLLPTTEKKVRNLSQTSGVRERDVAWSPDAKWIAFVSDETGTEELYLTDPCGKQRLQLTNASQWIIHNPVWSPDSKKIAFYDFDLNLYYVDISTRKKTRVDSSNQTFIKYYNWSPDSKWLTYTKFDQFEFATLYLYNLEKKKIYRVTDGRRWDAASAFDPEGKYLFFISRRDLNPVFGRLEVSWTINDMDRIYLLTLKADSPSPLGLKTEEVEVMKNLKHKKGSQDLLIDLEGLANRIIPLPIKPGLITDLKVGKNILFYCRRSDRGGSERTLCAYDLKQKEEVMIFEKPTFYDLSADGENLLVGTEDAYTIVSARPTKIDPSGGWANLKLEAHINIADEWRQMFREAWRWQKNLHFFEDMGGLDWPGILKKYSPLVDHLASRHDLNDLMSEMIGELEVSHLFARGGDIPKVEPVKTGLLGADFTPDERGYFRIEKIFNGENWESDAVSPLTEPGIRAQKGNYLLEINGKALRLPETPYQLLERTAGTTVSLKLNTKPTPIGAWTIEVKPISSEVQLRYLDWVEHNRSVVEKATRGRIGYIHIPDFHPSGLKQFVKMWYWQLNKEGIIIDERYNRGGFLAEAIIERIRRYPVGMEKYKSVGIRSYPMASFPGHTVMLINQYSGSDAENFPLFYRRYKLGPIIGTRTWGGVIGGNILSLMDGGQVRAADDAVTNLELDPEVENRGVNPDIIVDNLPNDEAKGHDAQLEKAIEVILRMAMKKPVKLPPIPKEQ